MMHIWEEEPVFCFTSDIDWASEACIEYSHNIIFGNELKLSYFNIHPNFLPDSSHGLSFKEVIDYCENLVPTADGFRSHRYFEVNDIMDDFAKRGFKFASNHCTRCETYIKPLVHRSGLLSIPIFFEDGGYLLMDPSLNFNHIVPRLRSE